MSSNVLDDPKPSPAPSTPLSSLSDDSDAVNSSDARIYFGPVLSPEKKLALDPANRKQTPVRRSSRLSSVPRQSSARTPPPHITLNIATKSLPNVRETRDEQSQEAFLEEPSSALASKVMRAWDNPSPPPSPPFAPAIAKDLVDLDPLSTTPAVGTPLLETEGSESAVSAMLEARPDSARPLPSRDISLVPAPQPDLITFDPLPSSQNETSLLVSVPLPPTPSLAEALPDGPATIDELLTISPQKDASLSESIEIPAPAEDENPLREDTPPNTGPIGAEEEAVPELVLPPIQTPSPATASVPPPTIHFTPAVDPDQASTPLRRSSRPRRSVSPLVTPLVDQQSPAPTEGTDTPLPVPPHEPLLLSPRSGPARRKSMKGKEKESPAPASEVTGTAPPSETPLEPTPAPPSPGRRTSIRGEGQPTHARLRSLSPTSSGVLEQLLPSKPSTPLGEPQSNPFIPPPVFSLPPLLPDPTATAPTIPQSASIEPPRTPARRVPITQAVKEGSLPTQSALQFLSPRKLDLNAPGAGAEPFGSPVFRRVALDDPTRSPAKRIPIATGALVSATKPKATSSQATAGLNSGGGGLFAPLKPPAFGSRSRSEEPQPSVAGKKGRSASVEPTPLSAMKKDIGVRRIPPSALSTPTKANALPFPIARALSGLTPMIPEVDESEASSSSAKQSATIPSSPSKDSSLRQPSSRAESRIPRIGAKPYARPAVKTPVARAATTPAASTTRETKQQSEPSTSKPRVVPNAVAGPGPQTQLQRVATTPAPAPGTPSTLKRKREEEAKASTSSSSKPVMIRKVVSAAAKPAPPSSSTSLDVPTGGPEKKAKSPASTAAKTPAQPQGKIKMRKVVTAKQPKGVQSPPGSATPDETAALPAIPPIAVPPAASSTIIQVPFSEEEPVWSVAQEDPLTLPPPTLLSPSSIPVPLGQDASTDISPNSALRRTTRLRKAQTDVFGTVGAPPSTSSNKPPTSRRRTAGPVADFGVFAGMSALALKSLTASNTMKNQQQVVELKTEVVRMETKRPDSPTTKVRTLLEKQKEDRVKDRQRRAQRRAKRASGEVEGDGEVGSSDFGSSDVEGEGEGEEERVGAGGMGMLKHRRGPGEDEDYETPPRAERPSKRGRFEENSEEQMRGGNDRRVKWDRGLSTTVFLDDSPPKPSRSSKDAGKGCLTPAAKTLRLDTMGNVLNATVPLADLVHENIIVKKFVYLDDPDLEPPPDTTVRATRSKGKKAKS
ncbi:hypothetical protein EIP91_006479 [Steccherinum ochraceum]|uniref:Uncharacterized protein n=1 Tax=Steccherinum ochraceum TaxID=92696 RepID=A0A4R0RR91_9APHY|nr:hypothetical protein EIP91_006479 [Steccherinum ochraceum]